MGTAREAARELITRDAPAYAERFIDQIIDADAKCFDLSWDSHQPVSELFGCLAIS